MAIAGIIGTPMQLKPGRQVRVFWESCPVWLNNTTDHLVATTDGAPWQPCGKGACATTLTYNSTASCSTQPSSTRPSMLTTSSMRPSSGAPRSEKQ